MLLLSFAIENKGRFTYIHIYIYIYIYRIESTLSREDIYDCSNIRMTDIYVQVVTVSVFNTPYLPSTRRQVCRSAIYDSCVVTNDAIVWITRQNTWLYIKLSFHRMDRRKWNQGRICREFTFAFDAAAARLAVLVPLVILLWLWSLSRPW